MSDAAFALPRLALPLLHALSDGRFHSGEALAARFGVTRASVSQTFKSVRMGGITIDRVTGRGYRLQQPIDWINERQVLSHLGEHASRVHLKVHGSVDSTSSEVLRLASDNAASGTVVATEWQSAGRGRLGRRWLMPPGAGIAMSYLWRSKGGVSSLGGLSLAAGCMIAEAASALGVPGVALKWPNDVVVESPQGLAKLAGVLIETQGDMLGPTAVVIGIGVNVNVPQSVRAAIDQPLADLRQLNVNASRSEILAKLLIALSVGLRIFERDGFPAFRQAFDARHALAGREITIRDGDGSVRHGTVNGVDETGALLASIGGRAQTVMSGDVSVRVKGKR